jgi:hypothetical protein
MNPSTVPGMYSKHRLRGGIATGNVYPESEAGISNVDECRTGMQHINARSSKMGQINLLYHRFPRRQGL